MPLPWAFSRNVLVPVRLAEPRLAAAGILHVRVFSDRWGGDVIIVGQLEDQAVTVGGALPQLWQRLHVPSGLGPVRMVSYEAGSCPMFREHHDADDRAGSPATSFADERAPFDESATGVRVLQHGPAVDIWDPARYRLSTFQMARIRQRARQLQD